MSNVLAQTEALAFGKTLAEIEADGASAALAPHRKRSAEPLKDPSEFSKFSWIPGRRWHGHADLILHQNPFTAIANKTLEATRCRAILSLDVR